MENSKALLKIGGWGLFAGAVSLRDFFFVFYQPKLISLHSRPAGPAALFIRVIERSGRGSGMVYYPAFTFADSKRQAHEINMSFGDSVCCLRTSKVGDTVTVPLPTGAAGQRQAL